jgi:hypothetical protein
MMLIILLLLREVYTQIKLYTQLIRDVGRLLKYRHRARVA